MFSVARFGFWFCSFRRRLCDFFFLMDIDISLICGLMQAQLFFIYVNCKIWKTWLYVFSESKKKQIEESGLNTFLYCNISIVI